jgi:hypothetical protein
MNQRHVRMRRKYRRHADGCAAFIKRGVAVIDMSSLMPSLARRFPNGQCRGRLLAMLAILAPRTATKNQLFDPVFRQLA